MSFWGTVFKIAEVGTTTISAVTSIANYAITPMNEAQLFQEYLNNPTAEIREEQPHWLDDQVHKALDGYVYDDGNERITIDEWIQNASPEEADIEELQRKEIEEKTKLLEEAQAYDRDHSYGDEPFNGMSDDPYKEAEKQYMEECKALEAEYERQNQELTAQFRTDYAKAQEEEEAKNIKQEYERESQRLEAEYKQKCEEAEKEYEAKVKEIDKKQMEEAKKTEEAKEKEEVKAAEEAKKAEEAKQNEDSKKLEEAKQKEEAKAAEETKKAEEAKQQEAAKQAKDSKQKEEKMEEDNGIDR